VWHHRVCDRRLRGGLPRRRAPDEGAPGVYARGLARRPKLARYWTLPFAPDRSIGKVEWIERLRHQLEALVRRRLSRDVPIGVFVSGGIDSGAVAARAARQTDAPPIQTFAVGFEARTRLRSENGMIRGIGVLALHQHVEWTH